MNIISKMRGVVESAVFNPLATTETVTAFQMIGTIFSHLGDPEFGGFRTFLWQFDNQPQLLTFCLPFFRRSSAVFYAVDDHSVITVGLYLTISPGSSLCLNRMT
jgi:hypothetical protein